MMHYLSWKNLKSNAKWKSVIKGQLVCDSILCEILDARISVEREQIWRGYRERENVY